MVKVVLSFIFLFFSSTVFAFEYDLEQNVESLKVEDTSLLDLKIEKFIGKDKYLKNKAYIDIVFSPKSDYFHYDGIDSVKVIDTLKENGLLNLFFKKPTNLELNFKTSGSPLFFVKIMENTLRNIGYYRYVTKESTLNSSEFTWSISLTSEYATDPSILQNELRKSGCSVVDIEKNSYANWTYIIDMRDAHLNVKTLNVGEELRLKRSIYDEWLDVSNITRLEILSSRRNYWYPKISYYDSSLHLLRVVSQDRRRSRVVLHIPKSSKYIKISDIYTLKNLKDGLLLKPTGSR